VNELVDQSVAGLMVERTFPRIRLSRSLEQGGARALVDPDLLIPVLQNIVRNACEAMTEQGGDISITTERAGPVVAVIVRDSGPGMDPDTLAQAFDLFFTTKAEGTGLGLAYARQVVEAHRGSLILESVPGEGTQVQLSLPAGEAALASTPAPTKSFAQA